LDHRRGIVRVETAVDRGDDRPAGGQRLDLHEAEDPLPHLADDHVETGQKIADLRVRNGLDEPDPFAIPGRVLGRERTVVERGDVRAQRLQRLDRPKDLVHALVRWRGGEERQGGRVGGGGGGGGPFAASDGFGRGNQLGPETVLFGGQV